MSSQQRLILIFSQFLPASTRKLTACLLTGMSSRVFLSGTPGNGHRPPVPAVFVIRQLRGLRANLSGLGLLSWLVNRLQRSLISMFRIRIQALLQVSLGQLTERRI